MNETANLEIKITLPNKKELVFADGASLKQWNERFLNQWRWLENTPARQAWQRIQGQIQKTFTQVSNWERSPQHEETVRNTKATMESAIGQIYSDIGGAIFIL